MTKQDCLDKLKEISEYKENWNGYGAEPIRKNLIDACKFIVNQVAVYPEIFPTANKSIQLEYHSGKEYIEIEIFSDRCTLFYKVNEKWAKANLNSILYAIDWWNVLTAIAEK